MHRQGENLDDINAQLTYFNDILVTLAISF